MAKLFVFALALLFACGSVFGQGDLTNLGDPEVANDTTTAAPVTTPAPPAPIPDSTTPEPEPTTTPEPEPTTTPEPEPTTTPEPEPTTTPAPDTTTAPPAPTTPAPDADYKYNVTDGNVTCVMIEGSVSFMVNYSIGNNDTKTATVALPKHPKAGYVITGTCNGSAGEQAIEVTWGLADQTSSVKLEFTAKEELWTIQSFTANLFIDPVVFVNATENGKTLSLMIDYGFSPLSIAVNHSFNCHSALSAANITGSIGDEVYALPISSKLDGIQVQAFNEIPNEPDFVTSVHCSADQTSDVVPIAVGCALAALVVIVLIAYLVGRRRRSAAYQSV